MLTLEDKTWLEYQNFGSFTTFPGDTYIYENIVMSHGGIRVEICGEVASVWCLCPETNCLAVATEDVRPIVEQLLIKQNRLRR